MESKPNTKKYIYIYKGAHISVRDSLQITIYYQGKNISRNGTSFLSETTLSLLWNSGNIPVFVLPAPHPSKNKRNQASRYF